jgi:hypothetical protein
MSKVYLIALMCAGVITVLWITWIVWTVVTLVALAPSHQSIAWLFSAPFVAAQLIA